jgi:hypothetical protein
MLKEAIAALAKEYQARGVAVVGISSNSQQTHPQDGPDMMAADARQYGYTFPYLFDESQEVGAPCQPRVLLHACARVKARVPGRAELASHETQPPALAGANVWLSVVGWVGG